MIPVSVPKAPLQGSKHAVQASQGNGAAVPNGGSPAVCVLFSEVLCQYLRTFGVQVEAAASIHFLMKFGLEAATGVFVLEFEGTYFCYIVVDPRVEDYSIGFLISS